MDEQMLRFHLERKGYTNVRIKRWKKHDWLEFERQPEITYGRIICTCRVEDVPDSSWDKLFTVKYNEKRSQE